MQSAIHPSKLRLVTAGKYILFTAVFLALVVRGRAQTSAEGFDGLLAKFDVYRSNALQEKLFVHTDKSFYLAGEVLWFKIYNVQGAFHRPLDLSKIAYVDVLDKDNKFVLQGKVALEKAEGSGSFYLPLTLASGNYKLRAYTNWMKNFGPDYFFEEPITIVNTLKSLPLRPEPDEPGITPAGTTSAGTATRNYQIAFFPEGGNLVKGVPTRVAFQVTDAEGRGVACQGMVVGANGDTLARFQPLRSGIGSFFYTPPDNQACKAVIRMPDDETLTNDLPAAYDQGLVMNLSEKSNDRVQVTVRSRGLPSGVSGASAAAANLYLVGQTGQAVVLARKAVLVNDSAVFLLDKASLGEGITQITLFDGRIQPVCERLYFKRPARRLQIDALTDKRQYGTRQLVRMEITSMTGSEKGDPLPASLSLSVYRLDSLQTLPGMNIYNYLWLSSDLKGTIESPETYFSAQGEEADQALDNLMMTHGWRRFRWENIIKDRGTSFPYPPEYVGQLITGRLTDIKTGLPLTDRIGYFSVPGTQFLFQSAVTDAAGKLTFDIKNFYGSGGFILHSGEASDSPCKVDILSPYSEQYSDRRLPSFNLSPAGMSSTGLSAGMSAAQPSGKKEGLMEELTDHSVGMQVQNVFTGDSLQRFRAPLLDSMAFFGTPDHTYLLDDYTRFTTMEEVLREYVREINVNHSYGRLHVVMLNEPIRQMFDDNNDLVLLDGVPVPDDKIFSYDPLKVKKLEVVPRQYFMGPSVFNGIASFTTYKGDYEGFELDPHSLLIDYDGLQLKREFYSPVYATPGQAAGRQPDFRNLLSWSPAIHTNADGKKEYSFYTSDLPGRYVAVIQGLAGNGEAGANTIYFEVK